MPEQRSISNQKYCPKGLLEPVIEEETISVDDAVKALRGSLDKAYAAEDRLKELLRDGGLMETAR